MIYDDLENRKRLSFAQAEGKAPLPSQMKRDALSNVLRARLWEAFYKAIEVNSNSTPRKHLSGSLRSSLKNNWVSREGRMIDTFDDSFFKQRDHIKKLFQEGSYVDVFDFIQFMLRSGCFSDFFIENLNFILESESSAYRIFDKDTIVPFSSNEELRSLKEAFSSTETNDLRGAHAHLRNAASALTSGKFADSVRESIHAVEATARTLEPSAELSNALNRLETSTNLHKAMKRGFTALYGYASDEEGIRHPLLEDGDANVDEADALFMLGACASFVTYLINKGRKAGLLKA